MPDKTRAKKGKGLAKPSKGKADEPLPQGSDKRRAWSHIVGKVKYSSGPGDNIYVFG